MKAEIQQVLKMSREGRLTDEQAAELLAELARKEPDEAGRAEASRGNAGGLDHLGLMDSLFCTVNSTVKYALDGALGRDPSEGSGTHRAAGTQSEGYPGEASGTGAASNNIRMSKFDFPQGRDHIFTGNSIRMSSVKDLRLERAEMIDNAIDMSKVADLTVRDGKVIACGIRASSVDDWTVEDATVRTLDISGSRVSDFFCGGGSVVRGARVQGASLKDFRIEAGSKAADLVLSATALAHATLFRTSLTGSEIHGSHLAIFTARDCALKGLMLRMMRFKHVTFSGCTLSDVVFSGGEKWAWKKQGFRDVRFEDCSMEKVLFADCRLTDVTLRNVTIRDRQFRGLELSGLVLDGNEAFLKAVGGPA